MKLPKGEQALRKVGMYLPVPVNCSILLTNAENDVLNMIRHFHLFGQEYISDSLIRICTGLDKKSIKKAKDALVEMKLLEIKAITKIGTAYNIDYREFCNIIKKLNAERNAYRRLEIVDEFRGEKRALRTKLREEYKKTKFNNSLNI